MKKTTDFGKTILGFLERNLIVNGFRLLQQSFYRKTLIGDDILHIAFIKKQELEIKANVDIRHNELERIYNSLLDESPNTRTATIGAEFGKLLGRKSSLIWTVNNLSDVEVVGKSILETFWEVGQPFLEKYGNLNKLFEVLRADDPPTQSFCPIPHVRAKKALVALYLLGNYEDYDGLVKAEVAYLSTIENPYLNDFLDFAKRLKEKIDQSLQ